MIKLFRKILCFIGWHELTWKLERGDTLYLNAPPPEHAKCCHCGKIYGKQ